MGCDLCLRKTLLRLQISIHAPRMGCDASALAKVSRYSYFNPRTPYGVRPCDYYGRERDRAISIHAPRMGCDTSHYQRRQRWRAISIHAPRMGCDKRYFTQPNAQLYFNPRTPYGVRPESVYQGWTSDKFQSTHPVWGATINIDHQLAIFRISIHAPRMGCDCGFIQKNKRFSDIRSIFSFTSAENRIFDAKAAVQAAYSAHARQTTRPINRIFGAKPFKKRDIRPNFGANPSAIL